MRSFLDSCSLSLNSGKLLVCQKRHASRSCSGRLLFCLLPFATGHEGANRAGEYGYVQVKMYGLPGETHLVRWATATRSCGRVFNQHRCFRNVRGLFATAVRLSVGGELCSAWPPERTHQPDMIASVLLAGSSKFADPLNGHQHSLKIAISHAFRCFQIKSTKTLAVW